MTPLDRRSFLKGAAAVPAGTALTGPAFSAALAVEPDGVFQYGVASGDPLPDGVDSALRRVVRSGTIRTSASSDHSVWAADLPLDPAHQGG